MAGSIWGLCRGRDFNGNGKADEQRPGTLLPGNGDGTFQKLSLRRGLPWGVVGALTVAIQKFDEVEEFNDHLGLHWMWECGRRKRKEAFAGFRVISGLMAG